MEKKSVPSTLIDLSLSENQEDIQLQMILNQFSTETEKL